MTSFDVWAPDLARVELVLERSARRLAMVAGADGWWRAEVDGVGHGERYRYCLDGGALLADPRSGWQPEGIDGPSAVVDHGRYAWRDQHWRGARLASAVLYELHVGTFSDAGTFDGAIEHLDDLVDLGVTAIEVLPVAEFSGRRGWGYDGVLLWAPHHAYGGPDGLCRLVDAAHQRGLAVVLDVVYNHLGPAGNVLGQYGPYFTDRYRTPWGAAVNFDGAGSDGVRAFVIDNALMWLERYHLDGLRLDAVHAIVDHSACHVLEAMATAVSSLADRLGRTLWLIAEDDRNDPRPVADRSVGGYGLDASWNDDFHHALHAALSGERSGYYADFGRLSQVATAYQHVYAYRGEYSPFRGRSHGRPVGDLPSSRFIGYLQNHDQIGNRATGQRSSSLLSPARARVGAALVLLGPFVPMLFMGEEWGATTPWQYFTDHQDPELARAVTEGRRREFASFGWSPEEVPDPQARATRDGSVLDWSQRDEDRHRATLAWHRQLISLRRSHPDLASGDRRRLRAEADDDAGWIILRRGGTFIVANIGPEPARIDLGPVERAEVLLSSDPPHSGIDGAGDLWVGTDCVVVVGTA